MKVLLLIDKLLAVISACTGLKFQRHSLLFVACVHCIDVRKYTLIAVVKCVTAELASIFQALSCLLVLAGLPFAAAVPNPLLRTISMGF